MKKRGPAGTAGMLLLRIAAGGAPALDAEMGRLNGAGWQALASLAIDFRLGPLLAHTIAQRGWSVPDETMTVLGREQREQALRALSQRRSCARLAARMNDLRMGHVVLKGGALVLTQADRGPLLRIMRDLDVLLAPDDAHRLHADLIAQGWSVPPGYPRQPLPGDHHLPVLADPENGNLAELHFHLIKREWAGEAGLREMMLEGSTQVPCLGTPVGVPSPMANFLHLLAHATLNRPFDPGPQVLADIAGLIASGSIDPDDLAMQARRLGLERALALTLTVIDHLAGIAHERWRGLIGQEAPAHVDMAIHALLSPQGRDRELRFRDDLKGSGTALRWLLASLARALAPGAEALAALSGRQPEDPLRYLAYPRWIARRMSAMARAMFDPAIRRDLRRAEELQGWLLAGPSGDADAPRQGAGKGAE